MRPVRLQVNDKEKEIANNIPSVTNARIDYKNCVCVKPWGYEFLAYESERIGIWYLKLNRGNSTSLHTHFKKDTIIIVMEGCASIKLIDGTIIPLNKLQSVYIPKHKFHGISSFSECVYLMEIEVFGTTHFSDKNDLLRLDDQYHRQKTGYETSVTVVRDHLETYGHFAIAPGFHTTLFDTQIAVTSLTKANAAELSKNTYNILLSGELHVDGLYIKEGSLLTSEMIMAITEFEPHHILTLNKTFCEEDQKLIYSLAHLEAVVKQLKESEKRIVLTSGCYDILHVGHFEHLKQANDSGDVLMVCLSSDEQITALKGPDRPINTYIDRINLFKTISYVDYVILYNEADIEREQTLDEVMRVVDPDVWTKGTDYTVDAIRAKHPSLRTIRLFDNVQGKSTTHIVNKIHGFK
jgi:rfaE bifunctional protein nucleotidyltransferase chain/domain